MSELKYPAVEYETHIETLGWVTKVRNGVTSGTEHLALRCEAFRAVLELPEGVDLQLMCRAHVENKGWLDPVYNGEICGTVGESLEMQAVQMQLSGADVEKWEIWYQVHCEGYGWMNWMCGGELAGTVGKSLRLEGIRIMILPRGVSLKTDGCVGFVEYIAPPAKDPEWNTEMASPHFSKKEISCDCTPWKENFGWCDGYPETDLMNQNLQQLLDVLEAIRNYFNVPVLITSLIRCETCNDYWGGIPGSYHTTWQAADIVVPGVTPYDVAVVANNLTGCGARYYKYSGFTHIEPAGCGVYSQE